jgi:hypothetical protein
MEPDTNPATPADPTPISSGKAAYEVRKQEKLKAKITGGEVKQRRSAIGRRLGWITVAVLALLLAGYGVFTFFKKSTPQAVDLSQAIPLLEPTHIKVGAEHDPYNSNPPTSGPHFEVPAKAGFREEPVADEHLVHSLEHGLVWISYHPRVAEKVAEELRSLNTQWTVITIREANDTDIALAGWGRLDAFNLDDGTFDEADRTRIQDFIKRYQNRGPEKIPPGQHGGV